MVAKPGFSDFQRFTASQMWILLARRPDEFVKSRSKCSPAYFPENLCKTFTVKRHSKKIGYFSNFHQNCIK
jgi:hypothetical protein